MLACRDVAVAHSAGGIAVRALRGVDFRIDAGESVALLGRSGSGKTTLLHVLAGLVRPTSGEVTRRGRTAVVFQGANLLPLFNAFENVAFAGGDAARAEELLVLVGLGAKLDHLPHELSGGEAQRVALARAIAQGADALLCDEPTGHLDSDTGGRVLDLVEALRERIGFALLIATHDDLVARRAQRTVRLRDGQIVDPVTA